MQNVQTFIIVMVSCSGLSYETIIIDAHAYRMDPDYLAKFPRKESRPTNTFELR